MNKLFIVLAVLVSLTSSAIANTDNVHVETIAQSQPFAPTGHDQQICDQFVIQKGQEFRANNPFTNNGYPYVTFQGFVGRMISNNLPTQSTCVVNANISCDDAFSAYNVDGFRLTSCNESHADVMLRLRALHPDALDIDYETMGFGNTCKIFPLHIMSLYAN